MQNIIAGILLILALGFLVFRLASKSRALAMNKAPSCHGDGDESCAHCHPETVE